MAATRLPWDRCMVILGKFFCYSIDGIVLANYINIRYSSAQCETCYIYDPTNVPADIRYTKCIILKTDYLKVLLFRFCIRWELDIFFRCASYCLTMQKIHKTSYCLMSDVITEHLQSQPLCRTISIFVYLYKHINFI